MKVSALVFGATGRLGMTMSETLEKLHIPIVNVSRASLADYLSGRAYPVLPTPRIIVVDASVDYTSISHLRQHETDKWRLIRSLALQHEIGLIASFSSGVTDFEDRQITDLFYLAYKKTKQENLIFYRSLRTRIFFPKIYTLIGPRSYLVKSTGWVDIFEQARVFNEISVAHPYEPRSWTTECTIQDLFVDFFMGEQPEYLLAPVCGIFQLADIISFFEELRCCSLTIKKTKANSWLSVPYVAPNPTQLFPVQFHDELKTLLTNFSARSAADVGTRI